MNRISDEDLLGYTLGALDPDDQEQIELLVRELDGLSARVEEIRRTLQPLDGLAPPAKPRTGLARRTCECIAAVPIEQPHAQSATELPDRRRHWFTERRELPGGRGHTSVMDFVIVAVVLMLLAAIILPAVNHSRFESRVLACQDNMREVGMSLLAFANQQGGKHLTIPEDDKLGIAGIFAPTLKETGFVDQDSLFLCAGNSAGKDIHRVIPTREQLRKADGSSLARLQRMAGGDFAFNIGQQVDGQYAATRNESRSWYVVLADNPSRDLAGRASSNHGGYGQNAFFEDGHIEFLASPVVDGDSIYENDWGLVAPGAHANDCVVAPSGTLVRKKAFKTMH